MKRNPYYHLQYMAGVPYLVSFGQAHADFKHDMRLNETGAFLWNALDNVKATEELVERCRIEFGVPEPEMPALAGEVEQFISLLYRRGLLLPEEEACCFCACKTVAIAGLWCRLHGPAEMFGNKFESFETASLPEEDKLQNLYIRLGTPACRENGEVLLRNRELIVLKNTERYVLLFPTLENLREVWLDFDGKKATVYCKRRYDAEIAEQLFYAVRTVFMFWAQKKGMIAIHSASVWYRGRLWLFSGSSGTGKSTHAELWNRTWGTEIVNGDLNLVDTTGDIPVVHGIPWCGTSGICRKGSWPLGVIVLLQQSTVNRVVELPEEQKALLVLHRCISPFWEEEMLQENCEVVRNICENSCVCGLECTPEPEAAEVVRRYIDSFIE